MNCLPFFCRDEATYEIGKCFCNSLIINRTFLLIVYNITDFSPGACDVEIIVSQTFELFLRYLIIPHSHYFYSLGYIFIILHLLLFSKAQQVCPVRVLRLVGQLFFVGSL